MLLLQEYISNFTCARYYFLYNAEFSDFYVNQSLAGQTISGVLKSSCHKTLVFCIIYNNSVDVLNQYLTLILTVIILCT
jgi:hypothetical protein